jgi:hypothetical protein
VLNTDSLVRFSYVAIGGVDSLVSLWDLEELYCVRTYVVTTYASELL